MSFICHTSHLCTWSQIIGMSLPSVLTISQHISSSKPFHCALQNFHSLNSNLLSSTHLRTIPLHQLALLKLVSSHAPVGYKTESLFFSLNTDPSRKFPSQLKCYLGSKKKKKQRIVFFWRLIFFSLGKVLCDCPFRKIENICSDNAFFLLYIPLESLTFEMYSKKQFCVFLCFIHCQWTNNGP